MRPLSLLASRAVLDRWSRPTGDDLRRLAYRCRRAPAVHWGVAACLAATTYHVAGDAERELAAQRAALGPMVTVVVSVGDHRAGSRLGPADTVRRAVPVSIAPAGALRQVPADGRLRDPVSDGEILTRARVDRTARSDQAAMLRSRWQAVAIPLPVSALHVASRDRVDLLAVDGGGHSTIVVADAIVLDRRDDSLAVAVPEGSVGDVADAVLAATLTVALTGS